MHSRIRGRRRRGIFCAVVMALAVFGWLPADPVGAFTFAESIGSSTKLTLDVTSGLKEIVRGNGNVPLFLKITNQGENFAGTLTVRSVGQSYTGYGLESVIGNILPVADTQGESQVIVREIPVTIKSGETWRRTIVVSQNFGDQVFEITLEDSAGSVVSETDKKVQSMTETNYVVGVMSEDNRYIQELAGFPWPYENIMERSGVEAILLKPEELAVENLNQDMPDAIVFGEYHREDLTVSQQTALKGWEQRGGIIIEEAAVENVNELLLDALGRANVNEISTRVLRSWLASDLTSSWLQQIPIRNQPNVVVYGVLLVLYAAAAGPGLYLVLKKFQRRYHLWSGMILLSLGFVVIIGIYSSDTRVSAPFITYIENIEQGNDEQKDTIDFGIQAPFNSSYNLYLDPSYDLVPRSEINTYYSDKAGDTSSYKNINIEYLNDRKKVTISNCRAFGMTRYSMIKRNSVEENSGVVTRARVSGGKLSGVVANNTGYDLRNVVILMPSSFVWVGELKAGESTVLSELPLNHILSMSMNAFAREKVTEDGSQMEKSAFAVEQTLADNLSSQQIFTGENSILLGQVENREVNWQLDSGYETYGYTFYQAPASVSMREGDMIYCPYVQQYRSDGTAKYIRGIAYSGMWMVEGEYTATYHLNDILEEENDGNHSVEVQQLQMTDLQYLDKGLIPFSGEVDFYNYGLQQFENIEDWGEPMGQEELSPYINDNEEMTIRYRSGNKEEEPSASEGAGIENIVNETLPQIQITGRVKENAEN